jgi:hypothetical protein
MQIFYSVKGKICGRNNLRCGTLEIDLTTMTKLLVTPHGLGRSFWPTMA